MNHLTFIPSGGLANRMRAIASAVNLSEKTGVKLEIVWFMDWGMSAHFYDLFEDVKLNDVILREATCYDKFTIDRARRKNMFLTRLFQCLSFSNRIEDWQLYGLKQKNFDFEKWAVSGKRSYMSCYHRFGTFANYEGTVRRLFKPVQVIQSTVDSYKGRFANYTVGIHIRRTDHIDAIQNSTTEKFFSIMDKEIGVRSDVKFFLATDDESVKSEMSAHYPSRIISSSNKACRDNVDGIRNGVAEMWALAATNKIYGSFESSYSEMASTIGGIECIIVK